MPPELLDGLASRRGLRHQLHVRLDGDQGRDALAQKRMVIGREDSDRLRFGVHEPAFFLRRNEKGPSFEATA